MPPKGEGKGKGGKGKGKGGIADFSDMKKEMPSLPPPAPAVAKVGRAVSCIIETCLNLRTQPQRRVHEHALP